MSIDEKYIAWLSVGVGIQLPKYGQSKEEEKQFQEDILDILRRNDTGRTYIALSEEELKERINRILDLVSSKYENGQFDFNEHPSGFRREGHDTDCGDNGVIIDKAIKILKGESE